MGRRLISVGVRAIRSATTGLLYTTTWDSPQTGSAEAMDDPSAAVADPLPAQRPPPERGSHDPPAGSRNTVNCYPWTRRAAMS